MHRDPPYAVLHTDCVVKSDAPNQMPMSFAELEWAADRDTTRFGSTAKALAKRVSKHYRISWGDGEAGRQAGKQTAPYHM